MNRRSFVLSLVAVSLFACKKIESPRASGYDFYPVYGGKQMIYSVDSVVFNDFTNSQDTFTFFVKEIIKEPFSISTDTTWTVERYKRKDSVSAWQFVEYKLITKNELTFRVKQGNTVYLKGVFPVSERKSWNANAYNNLPQENIRYFNVGKPFKMPEGKIFAETVFAVGQNDSNFFEHIKNNEVYAAKVGMVYKEYISLETQNKVTKGVKFTYKLIDSF